MTPALALALAALTACSFQGLDVYGDGAWTIDGVELAAACDAVPGRAAARS